MTAEEYIEIQQEKMLQESLKYELALAEKDKLISDMSSSFYEREKEYKEALKVQEQKLERTERLFVGYFVAFCALLMFIFALWVFKNGHIF